MWIVNEFDFYSCTRNVKIRSFNVFSWLIDRLPIFIYSLIQFSFQVRCFYVFCWRGWDTILYNSCVKRRCSLDWHEVYLIKLWSVLLLSQWCRNWWGQGGPLAPPIFGRSDIPIPTGEGRLSPPITTGTPNVFHLPASLIVSIKLTQSPWLTVHCYYLFLLKK